MADVWQFFSHREITEQRLTTLILAGLNCTARSQERVPRGDIVHRDAELCLDGAARIVCHDLRGHTHKSVDLRHRKVNEQVVTECSCLPGWSRLTTWYTAYKAAPSTSSEVLSVADFISTYNSWVKDIVSGIQGPITSQMDTLIRLYNNKDTTAVDVKLSSKGRRFSAKNNCGSSLLDSQSGHFRVG
ncbi:hypothetical protein C8R45DRAFT_935163 [Mycena sanguinolenta]|nr:hypothetical protein C8R45DRAFT_935163 [Mycena sanguinolenta]